MARLPSRSVLSALWTDEVLPIPRDLYLNTIIASSLVPRRLRRRALSITGHSVDRTAVINPDCFFGGWSGLTLGARSIINYGCFLDLGAPITIEDGAGLGYQSMLITCGHDVGTEFTRFGAPSNQPIVVRRGAWVGSRTVILPGVTVGEGAVIAAGSVVTRDCAADTLYAGVPAVAKRPVGPPLSM